jgi:hypothetical protein
MYLKVIAKGVIERARRIGREGGRKDERES